MEKKLLNSCKIALLHAKRRGATHVIASVTHASQRNTEAFDGNIDMYDRSRSHSLQLQIWIDQKTATGSDTDISRSGIKNLVDIVYDNAVVNTPNPFALIAGSDLWPHNLGALVAKLDLCDVRPELSQKELFDMALELEQLSRDKKGITNIDICTISDMRSLCAIATSDGFQSLIAESNISAGVKVIAGVGEGATSDYDVHTVRHYSDLRSLQEIARRAAIRTVALQGAGPIKTTMLPVVFDKRVSGSILSSLFSAISGSNVHIGSTFLKDDLKKPIFPEDVTVVDDPFIARAVGSRPHDGDCVRSVRLEIVKNGILQSWVTSLESGKKLGIPSTGHAGGPSNLFIQNGSTSRDDLISRIDRGILVTSFMGQGPDITNGDYSRGISGFLIEEGKCTKPVKKIIAAGNLRDMYQSLVVCDDLSLDEKISAPTLCVGEMTIGGQ